MKEYKEYIIDIKGLKRKLPLTPLNDKMFIGAFVIFGDVELTEHCARELLKVVPEYDCMIAPEAKSIPLIYEMARQTRSGYLLARKGRKLYMRDPFEVKVRSITTEKEQTLCIDGYDAKAMEGKRVLIIDDVISTGESLAATEELVRRAGGNVVARACILAEGDAADRDDIIYLQKLPLFDSEGNPID